MHIPLAYVPDAVRARKSDDFLERTRGPFWPIRLPRTLLVAVVGSQIVATLIAVDGLFMTPLGWGWALFVWGYALAWFLVNDRVNCSPI